MYDIEIYYETGDTFKTYEETTRLGFSWKNLDVVKENLSRIKEHNEWYCDSNSDSFRPPENPAPRPSWLPEGWEYDHAIILKTDDGTDCKISAFWCGYFETLYGATIVRKDNDDTMSFKTKYCD